MISGGANGGYLQGLEKGFTEGGYGWLLLAFMVGGLGIYGTFAIGVWYGLLVISILVIPVGSFVAENECVDFDWDIFKWTIGIGSIMGGLFKIIEETTGKILCASVLTTIAMHNHPFSKEYPNCK